MKAARFFALLFGLLSIFMAVEDLWVSKTFGNNIFWEQIIWHLLETPLDGFDVETYMKRGIKFSLLFLTLCSAWVLIVYPRPLLRMLRKLPPFRPGFLAAAAENPKYPVVLCTISGISLILLLMVVDHKFHIHDYVNARLERLLDKEDAVDKLKNEYKIPNRDEVFFEKKKNMVIVLAESMENSFNHPELAQQLMPRMAKLQSLSQHADRHINLYGTNWTSAAITGWFFGLPLKVPGGIEKSSYRSKKGFLPGAESIFEILKENGYELVFVLGTDKRFSGKDYLFSGHGGFRILDKRHFLDQGWSLEEFGGMPEWGFSDAFVFERALEEYRKLQESGKPFVLFVETVDTHAPDGYAPPDRRRDNDIRDAIREMDRNIAEFSQKIWDDDIVYAVLGDHIFMGVSDFLAPAKERHVFNLFHGDMPAIPEKKRSAYISAMDMAPTLLQAVGGRWGDDQFGLGVSLFSGRPSLLEEYGPKRFTEILSGWSPFYASLYEKKAAE